MAATVAWKGYGRVTNADSTTGWTALKISGTGGGPTAAAADGSYEGSGAVTCTVNKQRVALYYDLGSGLNFSTTYAGQNIYLWASFLAPGLLNTQSAGGFGVFLESNAPTTTQYHLYYFYGSDNYKGGFKRLILDPNKTASASAGSALSLSSIRYFGVFGDVGANTARFDNLICDAIDVGTGIRAYGTSTSDALITDLLSNEATNRYGIVTSLNDANTSVALAGQLDLGDNVGTNSSTITATNTKFFIERPQYYQGSVTASVPLTYAGINCVGNGTGTTSITVGKAVGTDSGRNGWSMIGNSTYTAGIDFDDGNVATSSWYGCSFENLTGTISWGTNSNHKLFSSSFTGCSQFDPVGAIQLRNDLFVATSASTSALLWNSSIDIQDCKFIANTTGAGIVHNTWNGTESGTVTTTDATGVTLTDSAGTFSGNVAANDIVFNETDGSYATVVSVDSNTQITTNGLTGGVDNHFDISDAYSIATPFSYTNLTFSGNTYDVDNTTSPANVVAISKAGTSNPSTYPSGDFVVIQGSVSVEVHVVDTSNNDIQTAQTAVYLSSDNTEVLNADTNASGIASTTYAGSTPATVYIRVRKSSTGATKYIPNSTSGTIESGTGLSVTMVMREDPNA